MVKNIRFIIPLIALALVVAFGCSDRGTNSGNLSIVPGNPSPDQHSFYHSFAMQVGNPFQLLYADIYIPESASYLFGGTGGDPVPLLILLPPQGGNQYYYRNHGLYEVADRLAAEGKIGTMVILTINNDPIFGGNFYAGVGHPEFEVIDPRHVPGSHRYIDTLVGHPAGLYDEVVGDSLIHWFRGKYEASSPTGDKGQCAIGGIGMGAYGAFRAAIMNPGTFSSVSGIDGPLDFDGADGSSGLIDLMNYVFDVEQPGITAANFRGQFDSSATLPVSRMFLGGALAFSPHDTLVRFEYNVINQFQTATSIDTLTRGKIGYIITDSTTLVDSIVTQDARNFDMHLPFSYTDRPYLPIWNTLWLPNNLENMASAGELNGTDVWLGTSTDAQYGFHDMTMSWAATLEGTAGVNLTVREFDAYEGGGPAVGGRYLNELLGDMLVFHSNSFYPNGLDD